MLLPLTPISRHSHALAAPTTAISNGIKHTKAAPTTPATQTPHLHLHAPPPSAYPHAARTRRRHSTNPNPMFVADTRKA